MNGKQIPTGFKACCCKAAGLLLIYGLLILIPSGNSAQVFLPLGAMVVAGRLHGLLTRLRRLNVTAPGIRARASVIAADLVGLIALQHGFIQTKTELDRGNYLGAVLCLAMVTPILSLMARAIALSVGNRLLR